MRSELLSSVDAFFSNLHFLIWVIEEMPTRLLLKGPQTKGKMLNNYSVVIVLCKKLFKKNVSLFASRVHVALRKLFKDLSWNMPGWPSEGIAPVLKCSQLWPYTDKIFLVFSYNHFTGDKQETENWAETLNVMYPQCSVWALGRECT